MPRPDMRSLVLLHTDAAAYATARARRDRFPIFVWVGPSRGFDHMPILYVRSAEETQPYHAALLLVALPDGSLVDPYAPPRSAG